MAVIGTAIALAAIVIGNRISGSLTENSTTTSVRAAGAAVQSGEGAFIRPPDMQVGRWYPLEFVAGPSMNSLLQESEDLPLTQPRSIFLSRNMRVTLLPDPNFEIRNKSETLQDTGTNLTTSWAWDVKPTADGTHTLIAQVEVLNRIPGGGYKLLDRYNRRLSVRVGVGTVQAAISDMRAAKSVGDALTALLQSWRATLLAFWALVLAGLAVFGARRRFRGRSVAITKEAGEEAAPSASA